MAFYNPYGYGYGGIGYVATPQAQSPSRAAPVAPVASNRGPADAGGVPSGPPGPNSGPPGIPQGTLASMLGSAIGSPLGPVGSAVGTGLGGLAGGMSPNGALGRGIGTLAGAPLGPLGMMAGSFFGGLLGDSLGGNTPVGPPAPPDEIGHEATGEVGGVSGDLGGSFGSGAHPGETDGPSASSSCVVTSELVASGIWPDKYRREYVTYCIRNKHGRRLGEAQRDGYQVWGRLLVRAMRRSKLAASVGKWLAEAYRDEIRRRMGCGKGSLRGFAVAWTFEPLSALIGFLRRR